MLSDTLQLESKDIMCMGFGGENMRNYKSLQSECAQYSTPECKKNSNFMFSLYFNFSYDVIYNANHKL